MLQEPRTRGDGNEECVGDRVTPWHAATRRNTPTWKELGSAAGGQGGCPQVWLCSPQKAQVFPHTQVWASGRLGTIPNPGNKPVRVKTRAESLLLAQDNTPSEEPEAPGWPSITHHARKEEQRTPQPLLNPALEAG